jgi:hypothetical protein
MFTMFVFKQPLWHIMNLLAEQRISNKLFDAVNGVPSPKVNFFALRFPGLIYFITS